MLEVRHLSKRFGSNQAVKNVSFQVHSGDSFGLLGPNGAGKSTTISMLSGYLSLDEGDVVLDGHSLSHEARYIKQHIGLVPQSIALYEHLTAEENLQFWGTIYGVSGARLRDNTNWCLQVAGLQEHRRELVRQFSGGMKRRLNIAVGLIHRPQLLIMDEPTVGIDPQSRNHILETVRQLNQEGMTVLYTSHYMEEVQFLCDRLAVLDHGEMIAYGNLDDVRQLAGTLATITIGVCGDLIQAVAELRQDLTLKNVESGDQSIVLQSEDAAAAVSKAVIVLGSHHLQPLRIDIQEPNLESVFLRLTGRQLRDSTAGDSA